MASTLPPSGGFLLSPAPSSAMSTTSTTTSTLPHPRNIPLRPGGAKESVFIRHVDQQLLHIQRRFAKRTTPESQYLSNIDRDKADAWGDVKGYSTMQEACKDLEELVRIIWISGTPSLQVPYLMSIGLLVGNLVMGMPPTPKSLFRLLGKMDHAFVSLLKGRDVDSEEVLPGFAEGKGLSGTEKVRIRSLVERTRVSVVEAFKKGEFGNEEPEEAAQDGEDKMDVDTVSDGGLVFEGDGWDRIDDDDDDDDDEDDFDMQIGKVYDRTLVELGDNLEEPNIGVITEARG